MKKLLLSLILIIGFFIYSSGQIPSNVPTNGLVGYWPFNGNANDVSGNGNNGTITGSGSFTTDRFILSNNAINFNNTTSIVCTQNSFNNPIVFSYSVWFKTINPGLIMGFNNTQCSNIAIWDRYLSLLPTGELNFRIYIGSATNINITTSNTYLDNQWHHVVCQLSSNGMKLFVDGVLNAQNISGTTADNYTGYWRIGGDVNASAAITMVGKIDDIGIWNRALTQPEITALYNTPTASSSDTLWVINKQADTLSFPDQVKLSIMSSNITSKNISAYDIKLNYDASRLKFDSVTKTNTVSSAGTLSVNNNTPGQIIIGWASTTSITSSSLPLLNCYFTPIDSGKTTVSISNAILNTDTVKNKYSKSVITKFNFGDVDMNKIIQSYDASLVLKYSVGIDPLPTIDPLPWEAWRVKVASVDTSTAVNANDASLILKYSVGLITKFPKRGPTASSGYVTLSLENNEIVVRSYEDMGGLNISFLDHLSDLSSPSFIYANNTLSAFNKQSNLYKVGLAFSEAPTNGTIVLRIPYTGSSNKTLNMEIVENTASRHYELTISTGLNNFKTTKLNIHPNPTTNTLHIEGLEKTINNSAMIYSIQGQILKKINTIQNDEIDLSDLAPGVYLIKINDFAHRVVKL